MRCGASGLRRTADGKDCGRLQDALLLCWCHAYEERTEYSRDVSSDKVDPEGEVVGPFRMPHPITYYANGNAGMSTNPPNALAAADSHINFRPYDNDGNGFLDAFIVVHAGRGAEQTGDRVRNLWSLKWVLPQDTVADGVKVCAFLTVPEDVKIGVCAHELGNLVFGWPDLYGTDGSSRGIDRWCLMAGGSWGAGEPRLAIHRHGAKPTGVGLASTMRQRTVFVLRDVKKINEVHRLWTNGGASKGYFLLKNRQLEGSDASLPGEVWHINDNIANNSNEPLYKAGLEQADGLRQLEMNSAGSGDPGDPFSGSTNNRNFTAATKPNSRAHDGHDTKVRVTNITALPNDDMRMNIRVT
ncbi:hypothetical protein W97_05216 [Coniosporium apollinis CBS 100218]|uniref:Peptidase M6-like domain-containing protein n=1 Tax=Coniosporium apollinis (strain CBS 100218) TaxID=1168221 RepID=R7YVY6_CONA1|nr:uncharacterized protein W97_05216 [Coniosporium apollinis CBS 100218]EON65974.1 hypothetical protein W97_05216 [Coniosporium apollinis CBS 100218]